MKQFIFLTFKTHFEEWCQVTTCAGVIDWYSSKTIVGKLFWVILIMIGLILTGWQTGLVFISFAEGDHYQTVLTVNSGKPLNFPNITICNFNRIDKTKIGEIDKEVLSYAFLSASTSYFKGYDTNYSNSNDLAERWVKLAQQLQITDIKQLFEKYGYNCNETFIECTHEMFYPFPCCTFATDIITGLGRCWNMLPNRIEQKTAGILFGVKLILNPMFNTYMRNIVKNNLMETGFMVSASFHHQFQIQDYIAVQPGYHYLIKLKATLHTVKVEPFALWPPNCRQRNLTILDATYSKVNCEGDCWAQLFVQQCRCFFLSPLKTPYNVCSSFDISNCVYKLCRENLSLCDQHMNECRKDCKNPCHPYWTVEMTQTFAKFISDHNLDEMLNNWSDEKLSIKNSNEKNETLKNLIRLTIYYPSLDYMQIETGETYPLFVFIANIGGQLSLWLGISIVTIIQAIYFICTCFCCSKTRQIDLVLKKNVKRELRSDATVLQVSGIKTA